VRLSIFIILSCANVALHLLFLLLCTKIGYTTRCQSLISTLSFAILISLIHQFQLLNHLYSPVQIWITLGLLQTLVVVFYYQGSFVISMLFWFITTIWISSEDSTSFNLQVITNHNLTDFDMYCQEYCMYHHFCVK
jgi:hypothetical protein